jgi:hypothetical protein
MHAAQDAERATDLLQMRLLDASSIWEAYQPPLGRAIRSLMKAPEIRLHHGCEITVAEGFVTETEWTFYGIC